MSVRRAHTSAAIAAALLFTLTACSSPGTSTGTAPAASGGTAAEAPAEKPAEEVAEEPAGPGLNTPVTVGSFEFTVSGISDIGAVIGQEPLSQTAQGTYLQVDMSVANVGKKSESFLVNYVTLIDAEGREYDADSMAAIYLDSGTSSWISGINPGNAVSGPVVFDVPAGTQPVYLQVSDSMFSTGETIALK